MVHGFHGDTELNFNIRYLNDKVPDLEVFDGNWIDVRAIEVKVIHPDGTSDTYKFDDFETVTYEKDDVIFVNFGFALDLTDTITGEEYVANIYSRSSLFKNYGLLLTNSVGCIDHSYKGNNDFYRGMFLALRDGELHKFDRLAQFQVKKPQPKLSFNRVDDLGNSDRNGYGSTGRN